MLGGTAWAVVGLTNDAASTGFPPAGLSALVWRKASILLATFGSYSDAASCRDRVVSVKVGIKAMITSSDAQMKECARSSDI